MTSTVAQPVLPQETPIDGTHHAERLPRHYILCEEDRAIPPEYQGCRTPPLSSVVKDAAGAVPPALKACSCLIPIKNERS